MSSDELLVRVLRMMQAQNRGEVVGHLDRYDLYLDIKEYLETQGRLGDETQTDIKAEVDAVEPESKA